MTKNNILLGALVLSAVLFYGASLFYKENTPMVKEEAASLYSTDKEGLGRILIFDIQPEKTFWKITPIPVGCDEKRSLGPCDQKLEALLFYSEENFARVMEASPLSKKIEKEITPWPWLPEDIQKEVGNAPFLGHYSEASLFHKTMTENYTLQEGGIVLLTLSSR